MAHYATLDDYKFDRDVDDIRGAALYGQDNEKLGTIDDVVLDHENGRIRYVVIDSKGWLDGKKFLIPAHRIQPYHRNKNDFYADLDQERVRMFPPYDKKKVHENADTWRDYEDRYQAVWTEDPVEHRVGSTHNITPEPGEMPPVAGASGSARESDSDLERRDVAPEIPGELETNAAGQITEPNPAGIHFGAADTVYETGKQMSRPIDLGHDRWSRFQQSVRNHREKIVGGCTTCGGKARRVA